MEQKTVLHEISRERRFTFTLTDDQHCLSVEGRPSANTTHRHEFCSCDLDLDPIMLIYENDLDLLYPYSKNEVSRSSLC